MFADQVGHLVVKLTGDSRNYQAMLRRVGQQSARMAKEVAGHFKRISVVVGGAAVAGAAYGIKLAAVAEQNRVAFETMLGSAAQAQKMMEQLAQFAASTPFQLDDVTRAAKMLTAFGVAASDVQPELRRVGDIAAGIGAPLAEIAEVYGKAKVQGRLFMEDINQLTGRGIPIIQELAKQFNVTESAVRELVEKGQVNFSHLQRSFADLTGEGGKFANLMAKQSETVAGRFSTMKDNINQSLMRVGQILIESFDIGGLVQAASDWLEKYKGHLEEAGRYVQFAAKNWSTIMSWWTNKAILSGVQIANDFKYTFTTIIPGYFEALVKVFGAALDQMATNMGDFMANLMKGSISGAVLSVTNTDEFKKSLKEAYGALPEYADRAITETEKAQMAYIRRLEDQMGKSYQEIWKKPIKQLAESGASTASSGTAIAPAKKGLALAARTYAVNEAVTAGSMQDYQAREVTAKFNAANSNAKDETKDAIKQQVELQKQMVKLLERKGAEIGIRYVGGLVADAVF